MIGIPLQYLKNEFPKRISISPGRVFDRISPTHADLKLCACDGHAMLAEEDTMNRKQLLDLYYLDARAKLIDLAAFLDRLDRADGEPDFRLAAFHKALAELQSGKNPRAERVLAALSDPTNEPIASATTKAACGAWPGKS